MSVVSAFLYLAQVMKLLKQIRAAERRRSEIQRILGEAWGGREYMTPRAVYDVPTTIVEGLGSRDVIALPSGGTYRIVDGVIMPTAVTRLDKVRRVARFEVIDLMGTSLVSDDVLKEIQRLLRRSR